MTTTVALRGRDRELQEITRLLNRTTPDGYPLVVVKGDAGMGKTRLLREIVGIVRRSGGPIVEETGWVDLDAVSGAATGRRPTAPRANGIRPVPALVAWDSARWEDPRTPSRLAEIGTAAPVLVLVSHRSNVSLPGLDMVDSARLVSITLTPLSPTDVTSLLADLCEGRPAVDLRGLAAVAAGSPGALVELVRRLREDGLLAIVGGRAVLATTRPPVRTRQMLEQRLHAVPEPARHLLQVASVIGPLFHPRQLTQLLKCNAAALLTAIDQAMASGLIMGAGDSLAFAHELVRAVVVGSVPRSMQRVLRDELAQLIPAERISAAGARSEDPPTAQIPRPRPGRWESLTEQERRVARLAAKGLTNQQIATQIGRTAHAVNFHLRRIYAKLDIRSRVQLASLFRDDQPD